MAQAPLPARTSSVFFLLAFSIAEQTPHRPTRLPHLPLSKLLQHPPALSAVIIPPNPTFHFPIHTLSPHQKKPPTANQLFHPPHPKKDTCVPKRSKTKTWLSYGGIHRRFFSGTKDFRLLVVKISRFQPHSSPSVSIPAT